MNCNNYKNIQKLSYNDPIFLIGMMGSGKTTIGKHLAKNLNRKFLDLDHLIELKSGLNIPTIFEIVGEVGFREQESCVLNECLNCKNTIIATGGGIILSEKNRISLMKSGIVVYFKTNINELFKRTYKDNNRPLLSTKDPYITIEKMLKLREPLYLKTADLVIDTSINSIENIINSLLILLYEHKRIK
ncbi:Shikimate kinase 1 [Candidatus Kinetoplastibacterium sorsogonicusi]|uniref:Shikimate kinase n=1 Tax=Candidatus Kinetoplastidibacterium kentomonadis TaxID=1576550 RepID=A0A3S7JAS0_9PROT|nr:shikimate kinase [Candidatus Kinetoplastibacterium sorsogonicusi]AWD32766.1 Shikimate kinase 1 [Candidatus Kinetoplastibacterium sorsogonicusi]